MTIRFYVDNDVQRLGKWLRFAGFDTFYRKELSLQKIAHLCQKERRIFITRSSSRGRWQSPRLRVELLKTTDIYQQIKAILAKYPINKENIGTRCMQCNVRLRPYLLPIDLRKDGIYAVREQIHDPKYCPRCGKIFWKGSHYDAMYRVIVGS